MGKRKSLLYKYMEFRITDNYKVLNKEDINPGVHLAIQQADDEMMIQDLSPNRTYPRYIGLGLLVFLIFTLSELFRPQELSGLLIVLSASSFFLSLGFFLVFYSFKAPDYRVVYNRLSGIVELPNMFWRKPYFIKFEELEAVLGNTGGVDFNFTLNVKRPRKYFWEHLLLPSVDIGIGGEPEDDWSFLVWYMDRNRPLPSGSAFDAYRDKDDARRQKEGNPSPLYPAFFD